MCSDPKLATEMAKSMDPGIYQAVTTGNVNELTQYLEDPERSLLTQLTPQNNTILHIVAGLGHDRLIEPILRRCPDLFQTQNIAGDLALHLAASAGHLSTVQSLITNATRYVSGSSSGNTNTGEDEEGGREGGAIKGVLMMENKEFKSALHVALENHHQEVGRELFTANPQVAYGLNPKGISSLYVAAKEGYTELVRLMLEYITKPMVEDLNLTGTSNSDRPGETCLLGKSLVHAAISGRNQEMLDIVLSMMSNWSELLRRTDEEGRTPLSLAASIGYLDGVRFILLKKSNETTYVRDNGATGFYPIHMASRQGHVEIIQEFLNCCPDSRELLDTKGRNILHVAAQWGKANVVSYVLRTPHLEKLLNQRDKVGETPLHLAVQAAHPKIVYVFTWDKRINMEIVNNNGLTARDVAADDVTQNLSFRQRYTLLALKSAGAPQSEKGRRRSHSRMESYDDNNRYKDRVNTLLLVSTLVATVTFAAGFTMPGGYNSSDPHQGMATLATNPSFHAFLICNTMALYSSIIAATTLIWAQLGDFDMVIFSLKVALPLLGFSLTTMSLAFMTGVYLVVSNLNWLAIVVMMMGSLFLLTLLILFVPLFLPLSSNHWVLRYIFYYPFHLMILATTSDADGDVDADGDGKRDLDQMFVLRQVCESEGGTDQISPFPECDIEC